MSPGKGMACGFGGAQVGTSVTREAGQAEGKWQCLLRMLVCGPELDLRGVGRGQSTQGERVRKPLKNWVPANAGLLCLGKTRVNNVEGTGGQDWRQRDR